MWTDVSINLFSGQNRGLLTSPKPSQPITDQRVRDNTLRGTRKLNLTEIKCVERM